MGIIVSKLYILHTDTLSTLFFDDLVCNCDAEGTARDICDPNTGVCICMKNFAGSRCDDCNDGYHRFPVCRG